MARPRNRRGRPRQDAILTARRWLAGEMTQQELDALASRPSSDPVFTALREMVDGCPMCRTFKANAQAGTMPPEVLAEKARCASCGRHIRNAGPVVPGDYDLMMNMSDGRANRAVRRRLEQGDKMSPPDIVGTI